MTRTESQMLKGVAILLMLFYHLFATAPNSELCHSLIYIGQTPLAKILSQAAYPVPFFLILGGYGLYKVYEKGDRHRYTRIIKLLLHYWITLALFVPIAHYYIDADRFPGDWESVLSNLTGYHTTYNESMWFLLPYILLSLISRWIFRFFKKFKASHIIIATLLLHLSTSFCISRFAASFFIHNFWIYNPFLVLHLLFSFTLGAMAARCRFFERISSRFKNTSISVRIITWSILAISVATACIFKYNYFYAFTVITCLYMMPMPRFVSKILQKLGNQSMNMWMIHLWIYHTLLHDFIFSVRLPLLILALLVAVCYVISLAVNIIAMPIERLCLTKSEIKTKPIL